MNSFYVRHRIFEGAEFVQPYCPKISNPQASLWSFRSLSVHSRSPSPAITFEASSSSTTRQRQSRQPHQSSHRSRYPTLSLDLASTPIPSTATSSYPIAAITMAEQELQTVLKQLHQTLNSSNPSAAPSLLSRAKLALLKLNALIPTSRTPQPHLLLARETLELGALISIRLQDPDGFTRYFQQLQPFYSLPAQILPKEKGQSSKITGLYLLLLLSQGDYAGFHTLLEMLELTAAQAGKGGLEEDEFIQYPIRLERALSEGSYDRVWNATKRERVPSPEFGVFSSVCSYHPSKSFALGVMLTYYRSLLVRSVTKSPPAPRRRTPPFPSPTPSPSCFSTPKALL